MCLSILDFVTLFESISCLHFYNFIVPLLAWIVGIPALKNSSIAHVAFLLKSGRSGLFCRPPRTHPNDRGRVRIRWDVLKFQAAGKTMKTSSLFGKYPALLSLFLSWQRISNSGNRKSPWMSKTCLLENSACRVKIISWGENYFVFTDMFAGLRDNKSSVGILLQLETWGSDSFANKLLLLQPHQMMRRTRTKMKLTSTLLRHPTTLSGKNSFPPLQWKWAQKDRQQVAQNAWWWKPCKGKITHWFLQFPFLENVLRWWNKHLCCLVSGDSLSTRVQFREWAIQSTG